jgi:hypothetical protein
MLLSLFKGFSSFQGRILCFNDVFCVFFDFRLYFCDAFYHKLVFFCFGLQIAFSNTANCIVSCNYFVFALIYVTCIFFPFLSLLCLFYSFSDNLVFEHRDSAKLTPTNGSFSMKVSRKGRSTY